MIKIQFHCAVRPKGYYILTKYVGEVKLHRTNQFLSVAGFYHGFLQPLRSLNTLKIRLLFE